MQGMCEKVRDQVKSSLKKEDKRNNITCPAADAWFVFRMALTSA